MKRIFIVAICILSAAGTVFAQSDLQPVAIVRLTKSEPITVKQLRTEVENMEKAGGRALTQAERKQVLDVMINERLAIQAAERDKVTISDAEVNNQIQQIKTAMGQQAGRLPTDQEFEIALRNETGMDLNAYKEQLKRQMLVQKYLMEKKRSIFEAVTPPTDAEINNAYNLTRTQFVRPDTVRVSMILVPAGNNAADKAKAKELTDRLVKEIGGNASKFDEAVVKGQSPTAGYQGGDAGYVPRNLQAQQMLGADFVNTAFSLKQGEVSKVLEGPRGYQIIKVTETYTQKNLELSDIAQLGTRITVRDYLQNTLMQEKQQEAVERASQELITELRKGNTFQIYENNINW